MKKPVDPVSYIEAYDEAIEALMQEQEKSEKLAVENSALKLLLSKVEHLLRRVAVPKGHRCDDCSYCAVREALEFIPAKTPLKASDPKGGT